MEAKPQTAEPDSWQPGQPVGPYTLLGRLAEGGMAEIWLARQSGLKGFQRVVVIKRISDALSDDPQFVEMFLDEARIAAQLNHPNIVQVYDLGENQGAYYITMEYLHGEDLGLLVKKSVRAGKPLPISQAVRIVANAADGLAYAHDRVGLDGKPLNIVHRDMSPQNVLVTYDGGVKVLDFGIAKARSRGYRTMDGTIKGKVSYLSPEQARGQPLDCRSDVFSLGIVLYEAVSHARLFNHEESHRNLLSIAGDSIIPPPSTLNPEIPPELDAIVMRALAKPLELRLPSARHLQIALEDWLRKRSDAPGTVEISATMRGLFADRIAYRTKMIESAQRAGPAPTFAGVLLTEIVPPTEPEATPAPAAPAPIPEGRVVGALPTVLLDRSAEDPQENVLTKARVEALPPSPGPAARPVSAKPAAKEPEIASDAPTPLEGRDQLERPVIVAETLLQPAVAETVMQSALPARRPPAAKGGWGWFVAAGVFLAGLLTAGYLYLRS